MRYWLFLSLPLALMAQSNDWKIVPGERVGPVTRSSSLASLQQQFGAGNVREQSIIVSDEGIELAAAIVYPDTPSRTLAVIWGKENTAGHPDNIIICYKQEAGKPCEWKTREGITLGTSLQQLERLNGRLFRIAGFGWDYGGTVLSWNGGYLEPLSGGRLGLELSPAQSTLAQSEGAKNYAQVQGDHSFSSGHPAMRALSPRVVGIRIAFSQ